MSTDDKNVAKLNRTIGTLIAIFVVPLAYFMGVSQHETPSIIAVLSLIIGGYVGCLIVAFVFVKVLGRWLPDNG